MRPQAYSDLQKARKLLTLHPRAETQNPQSIHKQLKPQSKCGMFVFLRALEPDAGSMKPRSGEPWPTQGVGSERKDFVYGIHGGCSNELRELNS